ncbi:MAG: alpha/beta hydrolase [Pseudomonadota bacterium]|nr:alpha/beta hydrolase [Pseudomonadota bacterium]
MALRRRRNGAIEQVNIAGSLASVIAGLALLNGFMFLSQPGMIFFPLAALEMTPRDWGLDYEDVTLRTEDDVQLHGWFIPRSGSDRVLLFFHGNAGNISHRGESIAIFHRLGLNVFIIDYRGYGRSGGSPGEQGLYLDARAAWRYLTDERGISPAHIVLFGRSLGGVVAAELASVERPGGLILESSFSSAGDAARAIFPLLSWLVVLRYRFDAAAYLQRVDCPVLVLHSPDDDIIPYRLGRKLYEAAPEPKRFVELRGGHNQGFIVSQPAYEQALGEFIATLPRRGESRRWDD